MSTVAGYQVVHAVSTDGTTWTNIALGTDIKPGGQKNDMVDRTYYGQGDAQKRRSKTLHDNQVGLKMDYDHADAACAAIVAAGDAGTDLWYKVTYPDTHGFSVKCQVENYEITPPVATKPELSATLLHNGAKTSF